MLLWSKATIVTVLAVQLMSEETPANELEDPSTTPVLLDDLKQQDAEKEDDKQRPVLPKHTLESHEPLVTTTDTTSATKTTTTTTAATTTTLASTAAVLEAEDFCQTYSNCHDCTTATALNTSSSSRLPSHHSSSSCHWCAHDNACHAVGSVYGCVSGVHCMAHPSCQRPVPEPLANSTANMDDDQDPIFTVPEYTVCNDKVAWDAIVQAWTNATTTSLSTDTQLLISVVNTNILDLEVVEAQDGRPGTLLHHHETAIGTMGLPSAGTVFPAQSVTDVLVMVHWTLRPTQVQSLANDYAQGTLMLQVDTLNCPMRIVDERADGEVYDMMLPSLVVQVNDLSDRHTCLCPSWIPSQ